MTRVVNLTRDTCALGFFCCRLPNIGIKASLRLDALLSMRQFILANDVRVCQVGNATAAQQRRSWPQGQAEHSKRK